VAAASEQQLDEEAIRRLLEAGELDSIVCATVDLWGRLMGKRVMPSHFLRLLDGDGLHASKYLFVVDMEMEPQPGFALTDWARGFDDFAMVPDLSTFRLVGWQDRTAIVLCDAVDERTGEEIAVSPRQILKRQIRKLHAAGYSTRLGSEVEVYFFRDTYHEAFEKFYRHLRPLADYRADYHILQTAKDEWLIAQIRQGMDASRIGVESSKGEWGLGQHEINLVHADALEMADRHVIYKNGIKEIAALSGVSATFMSKWSLADIGSSFHLHSSLWSADGATAVSADEVSPHRPSEVFGRYLGGLVSTARELVLLWAPQVSSYRRFRPESFAPTTISFGIDNRTCSFRLVGHGRSLRIENRLPGADANPYLAMAALIAGGLQGITGNLAPPEALCGNAYEADAAHVPVSMGESIDAFASSEVAKAAFGDEVFEHLLLTARHELAAFEAYVRDSGVDPLLEVTDWELRRYFERG